ncbi:maleylpyruvate isomerase family mycothiol-dependent enzyme [Nocardiopsis suaedae]|uniref:Maleylpyruvate isomerase family mycothiol-dependent enzyme n=1 Tax=Nocardiopsis suaedae TaxID=3018444 RepID=A0ABT4TV03_9ACTN|nr:maleylpyruvate isomerase family mycothiol-dependent enzyme [Nocardiopsis suaedae]MDA2808539.1 maleylpyruvate isomerase family mycothiol-dependent enzyme [Nocardiopsis suaedae]
MAAAARTRFTSADRLRIARAERRRIRATLDGLTPDQWSAPSLCEGWTVRDVAAHVASNARTGMARFLLSMAAHRFDHDAYNRASARAWSGRGDRAITDALDTDRAMLAFRVAPALLLVDHVVHHQDIRRPLGLGAEFPEEHLAAALEAVLTSGAFAEDAKRAEGRRVVASDIGWSGGEGPEEMRGTAEELLLALTGREAADAR